VKRLVALVAVALCAVFAGGATRVVQDQCGPFTDVTSGFCPYILEIYYLGVTVGTSATTFSPDEPLTRGQGAVFVAKGINQALARSSRRAALGQWWTTTPQWDFGLGVTEVDPDPLRPAADGADIWTPNLGGGSVSRVRASDGKLLETWTGAAGASAVLVAMGRIFVTAGTGNVNGFGGSLYAIDPTQPAGAVSVVADTLWNLPAGLAFDGTNLWVVSEGDVLYTKGGALSIVYPGPTFPWSFTTIKTDVFLPRGAIVYDGANIWFADGDHLKKMDPAGNLLQSVALGHESQYAVFDGHNIWVTTQEGVLMVVSAADGTLLATLSGNGLNVSFGAAFDGERVLVTNAGDANHGPSVSLWRAATLEPLGSFPTSNQNTTPYGACSDGVNFWITLNSSPGQLARF
jgi:S-layer homology domain